MSKVKFEIDTKEILELIDVGEIVDALAYDIGKGDNDWWADRICEPILERIVELLKDKNSELFKCIVENVSERLTEELDVKPMWNKIVEEKVSKVLKL